MNLTGKLMEITGPWGFNVKTCLVIGIYATERRCGQDRHVYKVLNNGVIFNVHQDFLRSVNASG